MRTIIMLVFLFASSASAQSFVGTSLELTLSPSFPRPNSFVTATLSSRGLNFDAAEIVWHVNGAPLTEARNRKTATIPLGAAGTATNIRVSATSATDFTFAERTVHPALVDLLWDTTSYTHPLYRGRRLPSTQTPIRLEALPYLIDENGVRLTNTDITFTWRRNGAVVASASGRDKATAILPAPHLFATDTISVEALTEDGTIGASASVSIPSVDPFLALYHDHPLFGVLFHREIRSSGAITDSEATIVAFPYFADARAPNDTRLSYEWSVNGVTIPPAEEQNRLTLAESPVENRGHITATLSHATDIFMRAEGVWDILFATDIASPFFGNPSTP